MVAFNFLFLPPVHKLTLADGRNWTALAVYVVTAVVASELATRASRRAAEAEQREQEAALLADAAAALLQEAPLDEIRRAPRACSLRGADRAYAVRGRRSGAAGCRRRAARCGGGPAFGRHQDDHPAHRLARLPHAARHDARGDRRARERGARPTSDDRAGLLETIRIEVARLSRLVENVLDLSRLQAGAAAPQRALWTVDDLLGQAVAETADPARVRLVLADALPALDVDAVQIQRALVERDRQRAQVLVATRSCSGAAPSTMRVSSTCSIAGAGVDADAGTLAGLGLGLEIARGFVAVNEGA